MAAMYLTSSRNRFHEDWGNLVPMICNRLNNLDSNFQRIRAVHQ